MEIRTRFNVGDVVKFYSKKFDRIIQGEILTINVSAKKRGYQEITYLVKTEKFYETINELTIR